MSVKQGTKPRGCRSPALRMEHPEAAEVITMAMVAEKERLEVAQRHTQLIDIFQDGSGRDGTACSVRTVLYVWCNTDNTGWHLCVLLYYTYFVLIQYKYVLCIAIPCDGA